MIGAALAGGFIGTLVLSALFTAASAARLTRIDFPFLLGTALTGERDRAEAIGWALHVLLGLAFSLVYFGVLRAIDVAGWWQGALLGVLHGVLVTTVLATTLLPAVHPRMGTFATAADTSPQLERPSFLMRNYGEAAPLVTVLAHAAYGAIVGGFMALA